MICDPYYYVCGTYPVEAVLGSRGGWDFGFNIGAGVGFGARRLGRVLHRVEVSLRVGPGDRVGDAAAGSAGTGGSANGQYLPLTFGFRF